MSLQLTASFSPHNPKNKTDACLLCPDLASPPNQFHIFSTQEDRGGRDAAHRVPGVAPGYSRSRGHNSARTIPTEVWLHCLQRFLGRNHSQRLLRGRLSLRALANQQHLPPVFLLFIVFFFRLANFRYDKDSFRTTVKVDYGRACDYITS